MELERCVGFLQRTLVEDNKVKGKVEWLIPFTNACAWFEKQVVSAPSLLRPSALKLLHQGLLQSLLSYLDTLYVSEKTDLPGIK